MENPLYRTLRSRRELQVGNEQVDAQCYPNLRHKRVFSGTHERLDFQVLLYPFKEQLDLPM